MCMGLLYSWWLMLMLSAFQHPTTMTIVDNTVVAQAKMKAGLEQFQIVQRPVVLAFETALLYIQFYIECSQLACSACTADCLRLPET